MNSTSVPPPSALSVARSCGVSWRSVDWRVLSTVARVAMAASGGAAQCARWTNAAGAMRTRVLVKPGVTTHSGLTLMLALRT